MAGKAILKRLLGVDSIEWEDAISAYTKENEEIFSGYVCHRDEEHYGEIWDQTYNKVRKAWAFPFVKKRRERSIYSG